MSNDQTELALYRLARYFKERAKSNRRFQNNWGQAMADTFEIAHTAVQEEIEALQSPPQNATDAVNHNLKRRS